MMVDDLKSSEVLIYRELYEDYLTKNFTSL